MTSAAHALALGQPPATAAWNPREARREEKPGRERGEQRPEDRQGQGPRLRPGRCGCFRAAGSDSLGAGPDLGTAFQGLQDIAKPLTLHTPQLWRGENDHTTQDGDKHQLPELRGWPLAAQQSSTAPGPNPQEERPSVLALLSRFQ